MSSKLHYKNKYNLSSYIYKTKHKISIFFSFFRRSKFPTEKLLKKPLVFLKYIRS